MRIPKLLKTGITLTMLAAAVATPFTLSGFAHAQVTSTSAVGQKYLSTDSSQFARVVAGGSYIKSSNIGGKSVVNNSHSGKITVDPGPIQETTAGDFVSTVFGSGLIANSYYNLTDNNVSCADSINAAIFSIRTDLNGRFDYPFYSLASSPCSTGKITITAKGTSHDTYKTSVTIDYAHNLTPHISVEPSTVTSLTTGSFATSVYVYGLAPSTTYNIYDVFNCDTSIYNYYGNQFTTDNTGNAEISWFGGPDFYSSSVVCAPGLHTIGVYPLSSSTAIYIGHVTLSPIHH